MPARDSGVVTIKVPFAVRKRGGRKLVLAPDGAPMPPAAAHIDSTLVKAIARAFRWQKMLETGQFATIKEIAKAEKINPSYVSRVLRLTLWLRHCGAPALPLRSSTATSCRPGSACLPSAWRGRHRTAGRRVGTHRPPLRRSAT